jgi:pyrophosphatase PpaX
VSTPLTLLFDLDGTLVDTVPFILACVHHAFDGYGSGPTDAEWSSTIGTPLQLQLAAHARTPSDVGLLLTRYRAFWNEHHDRMTRCFPGALETVASLAAAGHRLGVVTAKTSAGAWRTLRHTGLSDHIPVLVGADSCARCKPFPDPVLLALQQLGGNAKRAAMLGDASHDVEAARAAGVYALAAGWGATTGEVLLSCGAERVLSDIRELPEVVRSLPLAASRPPKRASPGQGTGH